MILLNDSLWQSMTVYECWWQFMTVCDSLWQSIFIKYLRNTYDIHMTYLRHTYEIPKVFRETSELQWKWISEVACALKLRNLAVQCNVTQPLKSESLNFKHQNEVLYLTCLSKHFKKTYEIPMEYLRNTYKIPMKYQWNTYQYC